MAVASAQIPSSSNARAFLSTLPPDSASDALELEDIHYLLSQFGLGIGNQMNQFSLF